MIRTAFTELIGIEHPVVSAGMGGGHTGGELVGHVSEAGGLGVIGASFLPPEEVGRIVARAREITTKPIGINLLLHATEDRLDDVLSAKPAVLSTAWPRDDQDLGSIFARAHAPGHVCGGHASSRSGSVASRSCEDAEMRSGRCWRLRKSPTPTMASSSSGNRQGSSTRFFPRERLS